MLRIRNIPEDKIPQFQTGDLVYYQENLAPGHCRSLVDGDCYRVQGVRRNNKGQSQILISSGWSSYWCSAKRFRPYVLT